MRTPIVLLLVLLWTVFGAAQENAQMVIPKSLTECYTNWTYQVRENLPPFGISQLIEILRKVEISSDTSARVILGIRSLSAALQHRFRQDGIERIPSVDAREGVIPFSPLGTEFVRHSILLRKFLPSSSPFPNETLSALERCTLHLMVSTNVAKWQRGDESSTCSNLQEYDSNGYSGGFYESRRPPSKPGYGYNQGSRPGYGYSSVPGQGYGYNSGNGYYGRNSGIGYGHRAGSEYGSDYGPVRGRGSYGGYGRNRRSVPEDVEIIQDIHKLEQNADLSSEYPRSECPSEGGVVWTPWGGISAGAMLAGVATGLERQNVPIAALVSNRNNVGSGMGMGRGRFGSSLGRTEPNYWRGGGSRGMEGRSIDNLWAATFAGDLAEVATMQGPTGQMTVGLQGGWNSTVVPRWYFLRNWEQSAMTTNNIRGDLDGLILGSNIMSWYEKTGGELRLSQVLDMYYSERGVFHRSVRACNRRALFPNVAPKETVTTQTQMFAPVLHNNNIYSVNLAPDVIDEMSQIAVDRLFNFVPSQMNEPGCATQQDSMVPIVRPLVDIILVLDTNWPYYEVVPLVSYILDKTEASIFGSNLTIINAKDGSILFSSKYPLLDHIKYTQDVHENGPRGVDLDIIFTSLIEIDYRKWQVRNRDYSSISQGQVVLFAPTVGMPNAGDGTSAPDRFKEYRFRQPDWHILFITKGNKNVHQDLVVDRDRDVFTVNPSDIPNTVGPLIERLKQVPTRLSNSACMAKNDPMYGKEGDYQSQSNDYLEPQGVKTYRLHSGYFFRSSDAKLRLTVSSYGTVNVCRAREEIQANSSTGYGGGGGNGQLTSGTCQQVTPGSYFEVTLSDECSHTDYISDCNALYLSVSSTQTSETANNYQCRDPQCRFPDMVKYSISVQGLGCWNTAPALRNAEHLLLVLPVLLILVRSLWY